MLLCRDEQMIGLHRRFDAWSLVLLVYLTYIASILYVVQSYFLRSSSRVVEYNTVCSYHRYHTAAACRVW